MKSFQEHLTRTILRTKLWGILDAMGNRNILTDDPKEIVAK